MPDSVTLARKILSCVARVQQRFGILHVVNVLRGAETEAVISRGHSLLSVFGLLKDASIDEVRGYIEQLIAEGFLQQTEGEYPILMMTAEGVALLKDPTAAAGLVLARQRKVEKGKLPRRSKTETESWSGVDKDLFEELRALRLRVARERGVPPYVIFHDTTLRELARLKPADLDALRHIYGVGEKKVQDLGDAVLDVIRQNT
jgi:ATP-dependent DNA helicase RecQ